MGTLSKVADMISGKACVRAAKTARGGNPDKVMIRRTAMVPVSLPIKQQPRPMPYTTTPTGAKSLKAVQK